MNELIRGILKSKTMRTNGGLLAALVAFWGDPALAGLPDEAKYALGGVLLLNMILRKVTNQSLEEKGYKPPDTKTMQAMEQRMREVFRDEIEKWGKEDTAGLEIPRPETVEYQEVG